MTAPGQKRRERFVRCRAKADKPRVSQKRSHHADYQLAPKAPERSSCSDLVHDRSSNCDLFTSQFSWVEVSPITFVRIHLAAVENLTHLCLKFCYLGPQFGCDCACLLDKGRALFLVEVFVHRLPPPLDE